MSNLGLSEIVQSILLLFIVMDPLGNAPFFYVITRRLEPRTRRRIINNSVIAATIILAVFALVGDSIMKVLGVTIDDFRIATGLVLLVYSILGFLEIRLGPKPDAESESLAIVPLATPFTRAVPSYFELWQTASGTAGFTAALLSPPPRLREP